MTLQLCLLSGASQAGEWWEDTGQGRAGCRWQANYSLRSAHFCISCQELRSCKYLAKACSSRKSGSTEMHTVKKDLVEMTPLNTLRCVVWHCCLPAATKERQMSHIWVVISPTHSRSRWTNLWFLPASVSRFSIVTWEDTFQAVPCLTCTLARVAGLSERQYSLTFKKKNPVLGCLSSSWRCCV